MSQKTEITPEVFQFMPGDRESLQLRLTLPQEKIEIIDRIWCIVGNDPAN